MRTLFAIIEAAKSGDRPTHDECYWAMLALDALHTFDSMALQRLADNPSKIRTPEWEYKGSWERARKACGKNPKDWVGPNNDPANPEYQRRRQIALALFEKVIKEKKNGN